MDLSALLKADAVLFQWINQARNPALDIVMPVLSDFSSLLCFLAPFLVWRFWKGSSRERLLWCAAIIAVLLSDLLCARCLKPVLGRPRPYEILDGIHVFKGDRWLVTAPAFRAAHAGTLSWPSCHAMNLWTAAGFVTAWQGWRGTGVMLLALLVCWSRIYLGVHYPLDVAGGAVLGMIFGYICYRLGEFMTRLVDAE